MTKTVRVRIEGRVQGVGFRDWTRRAAERHALAGWVRNRGDGSVEATFSGPDASVDAMLTECRRGPRAAVVTEVRIEAQEGEVPGGFTILRDA